MAARVGDLPRWVVPRGAGRCERSGSRPCAAMDAGHERQRNGHNERAAMGGPP